MPTKFKVLLLDDDAPFRSVIREYLEGCGYEVSEVGTCAAAQATLARIRPDIAILDHSLPDGTALDVMSHIRAVNAGIPVIVLTGHGTIDLAVRAIKEGAEQFLTKPVEFSALAIVLGRALDNRRNRQQQLLSTQARSPINPFLGNSAAITQLANQARRICEADCSVLVLGETGSGKGVLARWLHDNSPRSKEAFVDLNCAGLQRDLLESELLGHEKGSFTGAVATKLGLFEVAHRGTLFLDEIGDMDLQVQAKLLKLVEEKKYRRLGDVRDRQSNVRLIAATHAALTSNVRDGKFRADLYFRINTVVLQIPPLRERCEDIPLLLDRILRTVSAELGHGSVQIAPQAVAALQAYSWPGNIRQLRNSMERAVLLHGSDLTAKHFDLESESELQLNCDESHLTLQELEALHIERVLKQEKGHVERAAKRLGIPRSTLYQKLKQMQPGYAAQD